ncbi:MAG: hypothetical protein FJ088_16975, partial [Deltaproteobacteria bacterium]|nr:hypothetical protein [Deltaproteobacteria bacterium]
GTIGLWTSLLSLVGLIPGLQPIGAALATVAQICTLVSFICSAISLAVNAISLVINAIRWLSNKVFGTEQGVDFGSLMLGDVAGVVTAGISLALTNAGGTATAFRQGLKQGIKQAFSSIGQKFTRNVTQSTAKMLSMAGAGNLAKRLMPDVGQGVRGVVSQIYKRELQRLASTQVALGIPRVVSYPGLLRKGWESAAQTGRNFVQGTRRIIQLIRANRLNRQMQRAGVPVPNRFIRDNSAEMRQIVQSGVSRTASGIAGTTARTAGFAGKVVKETVTGLTRTDESSLGHVASRWIRSGEMSPVSRATVGQWAKDLRGSKEPSRIQSALPETTSSPADTSSID